MTNSLKEERWIFTIDTNEYTGGIERKLACFCTKMLTPGKIEITPGWWNDGLGNVYPDSEWNKEYTIEKHKQTCEKIGGGANKHNSKKTILTKNPAYNSVAIFLKERPSHYHLKMMKDRAKEFFEKGCALAAHHRRKKNEIIGFRLIREQVVCKEYKC